MNRRTFLQAAAAAPALLAAGTRPNILWIIGDDLGVELGCYGDKVVKTPNMDRIAAEGVRFTHCFTTAPVCSASRSAFNVGLYQIRTGTHNHRSHRKDGYTLPAGARLMQDRLRDAGYFTANVTNIAEGVRGTAKTDLNFKTTKLFDGTHWNQRAKDQPFYAQINFQAPHKGPAFVAARKQKVLIDPATVILPPYYPDHPVVRDEMANYYDAVQHLDYQVGVTLDALKRDGLLDNTVIFLIGDNGRCLLRGKQWLYDPGTQIPLMVRYPGVLPKGQVRTDPAIALDITAQTLAYAGIAIPTPFDGQLLFGSAKPRTHIFTARDRCDMTVDRIRAVRSSKFKLIHNFMPDRPYTQFNEYITNSYPTQNVMKQLHKEGKLNAIQQQWMAPKRSEFELYDLAADPFEVNNLAGNPKHAKVQKDLMARLDKWLKEMDDKGAIPESKETILLEEPRANITQ